MFPSLESSRALWIKGVLLSLLLLALVACSVSTTTQSWMFVLTGEAKAASGQQTLLLSKHSPIFAFADKPSREHRYLDTNSFAALIKPGSKGYGDAPPNAVITYGQSGALNRVEVVITEAKVLANGDLQLTLKSPLASGISHRVSIFIDAFPTAVNNQIT